MENISAAMAVVTPEETNATFMGFNTFHITKTSYIRSLHMHSTQYGG